MHRVRTARWALLAAFAALVASTQVLWLSFAPVTTRAADALGVSEGAIGDLAVVNPVLYVLLAIPAGRWADRRFGLALSTGAGLTAAGALLRAVNPDSYGWALAGQVVLSVGQPLVLNATTKVAARWFPATERTRADRRRQRRPVPRHPSRRHDRGPPHGCRGPLAPARRPRRLRGHRGRSPSSSPWRWCRPPSPRMPDRHRR